MRAEVPGADLYDEVAGDGPPLLSLSGSGSALRFGIGPATSPLRTDLTVVGYDHRGVGDSVDRSPDPPTMDVFAHDALALADHLGWDRFALHGLSFAGMVAQHVGPWLRRASPPCRSPARAPAVRAVRRTPCTRSGRPSPSR